MRREEKYDWRKQLWRNINIMLVGRINMGRNSNMELHILECLQELKANWIIQGVLDKLIYFIDDPDNKTYFQINYIDLIARECGWLLLVPNEKMHVNISGKHYMIQRVD